MYNCSTLRYTVCATNLVARYMQPIGIDLARRHRIKTPVQIWVRHPYPCQLDQFCNEQYHKMTNYVVSQQRWPYNCQTFHRGKHQPKVLNLQKSFRAWVCHVTSRQGRHCINLVLNGQETLKYSSIPAFHCTTLLDNKKHPNFTFS